MAETLTHTEARMLASFKRLRSKFPVRLQDDTAITAAATLVLAGEIHDLHATLALKPDIDFMPDDVHDPSSPEELALFEPKEHFVRPGDAITLVAPEEPS